MAATLDWSQCPAVESVPERVSGAWVFKDTRLPVATVFENLGDMSIEEVMEEYDVSREQIEAVLGFVAQSLDACVRVADLRQSEILRLLFSPNTLFLEHARASVMALGTYA